MATKIEGGDDAMRQPYGNARIRHHGRIGRGRNRALLELLLTVALASAGVASFSLPASAHTINAHNTVVTANTAKNTTVDVRVVPSGDTSPITTVSAPKDSGTPEGSAATDGAGTGVNYTPATNYVSASGHSVSFTVTTQDSNAFDVFVTVETLTASDVPSPKLSENQQVATNVVAHSNDPGGEHLTVTVSQDATNGQCLPPGGVTEVPTGHIGWIPNKNFVGTDSCQYEVQDAAGNFAVGTLNFHVRKDAPPTITMTPKPATLHKSNGSIIVQVCNPNPAQVVTELYLDGSHQQDYKVPVGPDSCAKQAFTNLKARPDYVMTVSPNDGLFSKNYSTPLKNRPVFAPTAYFSRVDPIDLMVFVNTKNCSISGIITIVYAGHHPHYRQVANEKSSYIVKLRQKTESVRVYKGKKQIHKHLILQRTFHQ